MVKDHFDSGRGNPLPPHGLLLPISSKPLRQDNTYHGLLHQSWSTGWNENSSMCPLWRIDPMIHRTMSERSYHTATSRSFRIFEGPALNKCLQTNFVEPNEWMNEWMCMTDAGTTQHNFILPAPPVGGLPISQDWLDRMKLVHDRTVPIILPSGKIILAD